MTELKKAFKRLRIEADETLREMAEALGVSEVYLSAIEAGRRQMTDSFVSNLKEVYSGIYADSYLIEIEAQGILQRGYATIKIESLEEAVNHVMTKRKLEYNPKQRRCLDCGCDIPDGDERYADGLCGICAYEKNIL
jgi:transcriptional regulator with XRE-family HTH domain